MLTATGGVLSYILLCSFRMLMSYSNTYHTLDSKWQRQGHSQFPLPVLEAYIVIMNLFCSKSKMCIYEKLLLHEDHSILCLGLQSFWIVSVVWYSEQNTLFGDMFLSSDDTEGRYLLWPALGRLDLSDAIGPHTPEGFTH
jgi:hypothetical protein